MGRRVPCVLGWATLKSREPSSSFLGLALDIPYILSMSVKDSHGRIRKKRSLSLTRHSAKLVGGPWIMVVGLLLVMLLGNPGCLNKTIPGTPNQSQFSLSPM